MLSALATPGAIGRRQGTRVPMDAFWAGMYANAASIGRLAGLAAFPSTQLLQNAWDGIYAAFETGG